MIVIIDRGWFFGIPAALYSNNTIKGFIICGGPNGAML